jgi:hypothetical protein
VNRFAVVFVLGLAASACDNEPWRQGVPRPSPTASPDGYRAIALGVELKDEIANEVKYVVAAPAAGTVTVQVDYVERYLSDTYDQFLLLGLDDIEPVSQGCGAERPVRRQVRVTTGRDVRIVVTRAHCWEAIEVTGPVAPLTLLTSFEPERQ